MRLRTINEGFRLIKAEDPDTQLTKHAIRQMVVDGRLPSVEVGNKKLFDVDAIKDLPKASPPETKTGTIRPVKA